MTTHQNIRRNMSILSPSETYVPTYPELVEINIKHERAHWGEWEVKLQQDVEDWKRGNISETEKKFITTILRLFTQSDVAVASDYLDNLIPRIKNNEARNMLTSFASREGLHQRAYALIGDTLGFGEDFYLEFLSYKEMADKIEFMLDVDNTSVKDLAVSIAKQALIEGVGLFAMFAMLMNFTRFGKMVGQGTVVEWSIKDESIHVEGLAALFRILIAENPHIVTDDFKKTIYETSRELVALEDEFIELAFQYGEPEGITKEETKQYIRSVCDYRMMQLGFKEQYSVSNPFEWLDWVVSNTAQVNFFEVVNASYSNDSMVGDFYE